MLSPEAIEAGASTVEHLAKLARGSGAEVVRAVATCAVREATNSDEFVAAVQKRTGVRVDVISGEEEARLINLAVRSEFPAHHDPLFLVDIGGGSTEFVVSNGTRVLLTESLPLGVVRLTDRHAQERSAVGPRHPGDEEGDPRASPSGPPQAVRKKGFKTCVGSSGTIQSLSLVHEAAVLGREPNPTGHRTLTRAALKKVNRLLRSARREKEKLRVPGLDPRRRDIAVPGGLLLSWILKRTGADAIVVGERGLREGLLLDYVARHGETRVPVNRDMRARSVDRLLRRGNAEVLHAAHVARLALEIFDQTHALHQLTATEREWLQYGALLHDIGCYIGYSKHQRHSYYLITHGDLTGFSADEIEVLASLARYHKGGAPEGVARELAAPEPVPAGGRREARRDPADRRRPRPQPPPDRHGRDLPRAGPPHRARGGARGPTASRSSTPRARRRTCSSASSTARSPSGRCPPAAARPCTRRTSRFSRPKHSGTSADAPGDGP